ncbi:MAG TPA: anhydro-N-acetylmuramic acid kinase [Gemmatimonadaceae bacterium]|nr:anhydro-N-acetylmuramic acid kinase [Gemmatimonadaceae bacterium]
MTDVTASQRMPATFGARIMVGLMSGTSADGISAAVVRFTRAERDGAPRAELLAHLNVPYSVERRERVLRAVESGRPEEYCRLNFDLGHWLADAALEVIARAHLTPRDVTAIASHGHTLWHVPGHSTWQTGESAIIAERTGRDVIADFRVRDVAAGGQGAPLVPIADSLLFADETRWRALQNIGGIGNVTVVPPGGRQEGTRAFDTGPGVAVIDAVTQSFFPGLSYDVNGALARRGRVLSAVVDEVLAEPYFVAPPPKSTGRELFGGAYAARFIDRCRVVDKRATPEDCIATAVSLTARSIADAYARWIPEPLGDVLLAGGGARNPALVHAITEQLAPRPVSAFHEVFFDGDAKEAVAFALMGLLHLDSEPGNVPTATGARGWRILGKRTPA